MRKAHTYSGVGAIRGIAAIVAFSGEREYGNAKVSEATLNGFSSNSIAEKIREAPYRFLVDYHFCIDG